MTVAVDTVPIIHIVVCMSIKTHNQTKYKIIYEAIYIIYLLSY